MATYYVDAVNGSDSNDGLSAQSAWRTAAFVSQQALQPGDSVLFRAGETFVNDPLTITASGTAEAPITIGRYGEGANPLFDGTLDLMSAPWTETAPGSHIWQTLLPRGGPDPRKFLIDGVLKIESGALGDLDQPGEWQYATTGRVLSLYSVGNPSSAYSSLDLQYRENMIDVVSAQYVVIRDIDTTMARYGVELEGSAHVTVMDCNGFGNVLGGVGIVKGSTDNIVVGGSDHDNGVPGYEHHLDTKLGSGIYIDASSGNIVESVALYGNFEDGIQFGPHPGSGNIIRDVVSSANREDGFDIKSGDQSIVESLAFDNIESGINHNAVSTVTLVGNVIDSPDTNRGVSLDSGAGGRFDSTDNTYSGGRQTTAAVYAPSQASSFLGDIFFADGNQRTLAVSSGTGTTITDSVIVLRQGSVALLVGAAATGVTIHGSVVYTEGPLDLQFAAGTLAGADGNTYANSVNLNSWIRAGTVIYGRAALASGRYAGEQHLDAHSRPADLSLTTDASGGLALTDGSRVLATIADPHGLAVPAELRLLGGAGADTLTGQAGPDVLYGHGGDDSLAGAGGGDKAYGDAGADTVDGGDGDDRLYGGTGGDFVSGGAGADRLYGQEDDDTLSGGDGDDRLYGGDGGDTLVGDDGDDRLYGQAGADALEGDAGADTLRGGADGDTLDGGDDADTLAGEGGADVLTGGGGDDLLDGGAGADTMHGDAGNDTFLVDDPGDRALESSPADGCDLVEAGVSFTLGAFLEDLILTGQAAIDGTGNGLANEITGNEAANALAGRAGADTLHGGAGADLLDGGTDADLMYGGAGDDTYVVDNAGDQAVEADPGTGLDSGGIDQVSASVSFGLGAYIENLTLTRSAVIGTGNDLANRITGNAGANALSGGGGADVLIGAGGADTLSGDEGADLLSGGAGTDTLLGGSEADRLDGGVGADLMQGGAGNDTYTVDDPDDRAVEADPATGLDGGGADTVNASVSFVIEAFIETLRLTGAAAIDGTGNDGANRIIGNDGANVLAGAGGRDTLTGGAGNDTFLLDAPTGDSADRVMDFAPAQGDRLAVLAADYGLAAGPLDPDWFETAAAASRAHAEFVYNPATRALLWDPDGAGGAGSVTIATFATAVTLHDSDLVVL